MDTLCLGFLYFGNSLRNIKTSLGWFLNPKKALKMVFVVRSISVFSKFSLDPYYEPLPWFMIGHKEYNNQALIHIADTQIIQVLT